ncbi:hypothetical protein NKI96_00415 [Mesorhizobium sp. M0292]
MIGKQPDVGRKGGMRSTVEVRRLHEFRHVDDADPPIEQTLAGNPVFGGDHASVQDKAVDRCRNIQDAASRQTGKGEEFLVGSKKET